MNESDNFMLLLRCIHNRSSFTFGVECSMAVAGTCHFVGAVTVYSLSFQCRRRMGRTQLLMGSRPPPATHRWQQGTRNNSRPGLTRTTHRGPSSAGQDLTWK